MRLCISVLFYGIFSGDNYDKYGLNSNFHTFLHNNFYQFLTTVDPYEILKYNCAKTILSIIPYCIYFGHYLLVHLPVRCNRNPLGDSNLQPLGSQIIIQNMQSLFGL